MSMFNWFSNSRSRFNVKKTKVNLDKKYEISSLDDHIFLHIPKFRFYGMALSSPSSKYLISSCRNMLALVDDDEKQILFIYDIFHQIDISKAIITDHPYIAIADVVSLGNNRSIDIYLLNYRSDILFKLTLDKHIQIITISDDAELLAFQTADDKIHLYNVKTNDLITSWKTPRKIAKKLKIDLDAKTILMVDYTGHVYTLSYKGDLL